MPHAPTNEQSPASILSDSEYDALAELFLGAEGNPSPPLRLHRQDDTQRSQASATPVSAKPATIEALILGHLPILAGPWVAQYARHVADTHHESVGLIRLYAGQCSLDLFTPHKIEEFAPTSHLSQAIQRAIPYVNRWVIRVDAIDEPTLANTPGINSMTLLSSTDDAAVVSAYQTIKRLDPGILPDALPHDVCVVFIGATDHASDEASGKLTRAVDAFLETPVKTDIGPFKLGPCAGHNVYRGDAPEDLTMLLKQLTQPVTQQSGSSTSTPPPARLGTPSAQSHPASTAPPMRQSIPTPSTKTERLAVHLPELRDLGITCPYATGISIAFDRNGRLHLLCTHTDTSFQSLQIARVWALDHAALLATFADALGLRDTPLDSNANIVMHIFTDSVDRVRRLLDAPVRFHLLTDVHVNNTVTQVCVPLNS